MGFLPFTPRASPTVFGLLWVSFQDYPPTHWLPMPLLSTCLLHRYLFHDKIPFCLFLLYASTSLPSSMACIPTIYYFFWVKYHPNKVYSQKKSQQETKYRPHFLPTTKPHPLNPLDCGPTSLVLAGYRLVVLRPFCVCFPHRFCCSRLVLFRFAACFVLYLHKFPAMFIIFLWFGFLFFSLRDSCCWHFLSFLVSFCRASSYQFSSLSFYTKEFGPLWAK